MRMNGLSEAGAPRRFSAEVENAMARDRTAWFSAWEEPVGRPLPAPVRGEHLAEWLRQHHLPILVAFAAAHPDDAAFAIQQGADYVEPDLVMTQDAVLIARHENEIGATTNIADHVEFATRRTTKVIDGIRMEGWFTEDFTLAELKTLRARERIADVRPDNVRFDGQFEIATFEEILALVRAAESERGVRAQLLGLPAPPPSTRLFESK